jgi:hypothetical protein
MEVVTSGMYHQIPLIPSDVVEEHTNSFLRNKSAVVISPEHCRSIQIYTPDNSANGQVIDPDMFDTSKSVKGYPLYPVELTHWSTAKYGVQAYGLLDNFSLERVDLASAYMRSHGLQTETVQQKAKVEKVLYKSEYIPVDDWRRMMIEDPPSITDPNNKFKRVPKELVQKYLREAEFYTTVRDMPMGERIADMIYSSHFVEPGAAYFDDEGMLRLIRDNKPFTDAADILKRTHDEHPPYFEAQLREVTRLIQLFPKRRGIINSGFYFQKLMKKVIERHNSEIDLAIKNRKDVKPYFTNTSSENLDHLIYFLNVIIPIKVGEYLGKFHAIGLHHGFASTHNWEPTPSLVDLDSVGGAPLGDEPTTEKQILDDVNTTMDTLLMIDRTQNTKVDIKDSKPRTYRGFIEQIKAVKNTKVVNPFNFHSMYIIETARARNLLKPLDKSLEKEELDLSLLEELSPLYGHNGHPVHRDKHILRNMLIVLKGFRDIETKPRDCL